MEELGHSSCTRNFAPSGLGRHLGTKQVQKFWSSSPLTYKMTDASQQHESGATEKHLEIENQGELTEEDHQGLTGDLERIFAEFCLANQIENKSKSDSGQAVLGNNQTLSVSTH